MSGYQPVGTELLYANFGAGTASTPTTTPGSNMMNGYPAIPVPAGYMKNTGSWASSLVFECGGLLIATATVPTWQMFLYLTTAQPAAWGSTLTLGNTATWTPTATTGCWFTMRVNIGLRTAGTVAAGAGDNTSTVVAIGEMRYELTAASTATVNTIPVSPATSYSPTCTTYDATQQYFLWPSLSLGAATAGNTITMEYVKLYGEN